MKIASGVAFFLILVFAAGVWVGYKQREKSIPKTKKYDTTVVDSLIEAHQAEADSFLRTIDSLQEARKVQIKEVFIEPIYITDTLELIEDFNKILKYE